MDMKHAKFTKVESFADLVNLKATHEDVTQDISRFIDSCRGTAHLGIEPGSFQQFFLDEILSVCKTCIRCGADTGTGSTAIGGTQKAVDEPIPGDYLIYGVCQDCMPLDDTKDALPQDTPRYQVSAEHLGQMIWEYHRFMLAYKQATAYRPFSCDKHMLNKDFLLIVCIDREHPNRRWGMPYPYSDDDKLTYVSDDPGLLDSAKALAAGLATAMLPSGALRDKTKLFAVIGSRDD